MSDEFRRLLEDESQAPLRAVLESGLRDKPSRQALGRASRALGISAAGLGVARSVAAAETARALHTSLWVGLTKWGAAGLLLGGLALSPFVSQTPAPQPIRVRHRNAPPILAGNPEPAITFTAPAQGQSPSVAGPSAPKAVSTTAAPHLPDPGPAASATPSGPRAASNAAFATPIDGSAIAPPATAPAKAPQVDQLDAEVALLDAARTALKRDDPHAALTWLDRHARLTAPSLGAEATLLRVQALLAAGRAAEARAVARAALAGTTASAYAQRLRKLAGLPE